MNNSNSRDEKLYFNAWRDKCLEHFLQFTCGKCYKMFFDVMVTTVKLGVHANNTPHKLSNNKRNVYQLR